MNTRDCKVIIVGGGLVGSLCALFMTKRGFKTELYEYREDPRVTQFARGRSINLALSNRARKALQKVGIEKKILACGVPMKGRFIHNLNNKNKSLEFDPRTKQCTYSVSRNFLNEQLLEEVENHPNVQLHFNHKLINVDLENGHLTFLQMKTGKTIDVSGDLLIGADGAFSTVRRAIQQVPLFNFSQTYIDHGYIEMSIEPDIGKTIEANYIHIWPRKDFMMIALPNLDNSWTVTLFMSLDKFKELDSSTKVLNFFRRFFPDSVKLLGEKQLVEDFILTKPSPLVSIKCSSFHAGGNTLIIGDAAHAMVPFYGQGMNAGFEDCLLLDSLLESYNNNFPLVLRKFTEIRRDDAHAICDLAMYNYREMRDLVTRPSYLIRKKIDDLLFKLLPNTWIPLFNSVVLSEMSYTGCINNRKWQDKVLLHVIIGTVVLMSSIVIFSFYNCQRNND
ncbi:hypothetical protein ILUMI_02206 [Ignelater luminosus]|uniref:Kynurenine 3-monooxygenase n=1 Tax=Ignelater luminosus TaxID=2038154 RepID=A0A8K0DGV4_IGNLU|nr:hypothetical protein ILUMI_02206 [Ignelater luminosus]